MGEPAAAKAYGPSAPGQVPVAPLDIVVDNGDVVGRCPSCGACVSYGQDPASCHGCGARLSWR